MLNSYEEELKQSRKKRKKVADYDNRRDEDFLITRTDASIDSDYKESKSSEGASGYPRPPSNAPGSSDKHDSPGYPGSDAPNSKVRNGDPYLTFPGYVPGGPPNAPGYDPRFGPPPAGGGPGVGPGSPMGMPPPYYPYYPPYYPKRPLDPFGATALTVGIVSMCIFWLSIIPVFIGTVIFIVIVCLTGIGIIFGGYSFANKKRRSISGLVGMILSIIGLVLASILWSYTNYMWGYW